MSPSAADLERVFREQLRAVAHALSGLGAEYMLIGGLAVGIWTEVRATKDAGLSVRVPADPESLRARLLASGLEVVAGDLPRALAQGEAVRFQRGGHGGESVVVDMLFAVTPFELEALARREPLHVLGVDLPVATPEDLFVFKMIAGRPQDLADAAALAELHGAVFDWARIRRWCREFGVEDRVAAFAPPS